MIAAAWLMSHLISAPSQGAENALLQACGGAGIATLGAELVPPDVTMSSVVLGNQSGAPAVTPINVASGKAVLAPATVADWQTKLGQIPGPVLVWTKADGTKCSQAVSGGGSAPPAGLSRAGAGDLGGAIRPATGDCVRDALTWTAAIEQGDRRRHRTVLVFRGGNLCFRSDSIRPATHGDPIYVGILTDNPEAWTGATTTFTPCDIESATPMITPGDTFPNLSARQAAQWHLLTAVPNSCWNDAVKIEVKGPSAQVGFVLPQYPRYRATVHLGTLFTEQHKETFGLQLVDGVKRIVNKGPTNNGPEYMASVVFYSVLKYLPTLLPGRAPYKGREIRNEQGILDRVGFMTGVGLKDPTERFVYGFTFEVVSGVNVFGGWERAVVNVLPKELDASQPFAGEEKDLQIGKEWRSKKVAGLTLDLAYAAKLFK